MTPRFESDARSTPASRRSRCTSPTTPAAIPDTPRTPSWSAQPPQPGVAKRALWSSGMPSVGSSS
jgi:hypothetical protein